MPSLCMVANSDLVDSGFPLARRPWALVTILGHPLVRFETCHLASFKKRMYSQ
jgi:hypothetical protein